jgi:ribA/ribD-fused uncharacterized protein
MEKSDGAVTLSVPDFSVMFYRGWIDMSTEVDTKLLLNFYKTRAKHPENAIYLDDGNLQFSASDKRSSKKKTITLPDYRPPTAEELQEQDRARMEQITELQSAFETARQALFSAVQEGTATRGEIIRLNRAVEEADIALQAARYPLRGVHVYASIPIRQILLDETDERRLFDVAAFISRTHELQELYVRQGEAPPSENALMAALENEERAERHRYRRAGIIFIKSYRAMKVSDVIISTDPTAQYGFLAMDFPVMITVNGTAYRSANHALLGELAKSLNDTAMFDRIRTSAEPEKIAYAFGDSAGVTEEQWDIQRAKIVQKVLREKFGQHPELAERLVMTGQAVLAADTTGDMLFGIGLDMENPKALKPRKWVGQNLIGKTLETIRSEVVRSRERAEAGVAQTLRAGVGAGVAAAQSAVAQVADVAAEAVDAAGAAVDAVASAVGLGPAPAPPALVIKKKKLRIVP